MERDDAAAAGLYSLEPNPQPYSTQRQNQLRNEAIHFHDLYEEFSKKFYDYQNFYVISTKWFNRWKVYTSYNEVMANKSSNKFIGAGQLPILNEDIADTKIKSDIIFQEPYHHLNMALVDNLKVQVDYILVNKPLWQILAKYKNIQLNRKMVQGKDGKIVQVYFQKVIANIVCNGVLKDIEKHILKQFKKIRLQLPQYQSTKELIPIISEKIRQCLSIDKTMSQKIDISKQNLKVWIVQQNMSQSQLINNFEKGCRANRSFSYKLSFPGKKADITETQLYKLEIPSNSLIVFEFKQQKEDWVFFTKQHPLVASKCNYCKTVKLLNVFCSCMYVCYCSKQCKNKDKKQHKIRCEREAESSEEEKSLAFSQSLKNGRIGLYNLGNICFMNSGIQCISSISELTEYFLKKNYIQDINKDNPLNTKGQLSIAYEELIRKMWCTNKNYTSPIIFKEVIGKFQPSFIEYQQHDSVEFISYLLDGLHQDLNRVKVKPYVQVKKYNGRPDNVLSEEGWNHFLKRNQSIIVQTIFGQNKSRLQCLKCQQQSITFDPFITFSLPIPSKKIIKKIQVTLMKNHIQSIKTTVLIKISQDFTFQSIIDQLAEQYNMSHKMVVCVINTFSFQLINNTKNIAFTFSQNKYKQLLFRQLQPFQNPEIDQPINVQNSLCLLQSKNQTYRRNMTFKKTYYFNKSMTLKQIHLRLFSFYKDFLNVQNYENQIINVKPDDQKWRILIVSNKFGKCYFCKTVGCGNCVLPFSDKITLQNMLAIIKPGNNYKFELQIFWRKQTYSIEKCFKNIQIEQKVVSIESVSIYDCFRMAQQPQKLDQQNKWYCPNCKQFVLAVKQLTLYKAPKVLILHFTRFQGKKQKGFFTTKLQTNIDFPIQGLDINEFLADKQLPGVYSQQSSKNILYDLFAINNNYGVLGGGHYTAFAKKDNKWDQYDDISVKTADPKSLVSPAAYILFYKRREQ